MGTNRVKARIARGNLLEGHRQSKSLAHLPYYAGVTHRQSYLEGRYLIFPLQKGLTPNIHLYSIPLVQSGRTAVSKTVGVGSNPAGYALFGIHFLFLEGADAVFGCLEYILYLWCISLCFGLQNTTGCVIIET